MPEFLKNILWATDFSEEAQEALLYAHFFAKAYQAGLTALHVVSDFSPALYDPSLAITVDVVKRLEVLKKEAHAKIEAIGKKKKVPFQKIVVVDGSVSKTIIEVSEKEKAGLIVMGKKGISAIDKLLIGSVANQVLRHSLIPLLLTRKKEGKPRVKKILVPTDFSPRENLEREFAWRLAKSFGASLTFLHVFELQARLAQWELEEMFKALLAKLQQREKKEKEDIKIKEEVTRAMEAWSGIVEYAETNHFDLIVMSSIARKLGRFFLGSTTEKVISLSDVPVFAIPPRESLKL